MNRILILSKEPNDLSDLILRSCAGSEYHTFAEGEGLDWNTYDAFALLGGNQEEPYTMHPFLRVKFDKALDAGKPIFCEFLSSFGGCYSNDAIHGITHQRLVYRDWVDTIDGLKSGDLLDGHCNDCYQYITCGSFPSSAARPILAYHEYVSAHDHKDMDDLTFAKGFPALWKLSDTTLICGFRLCNFRRARFAPQENWKKVLNYVLSFLAGEVVAGDFLPPTITHKNIPAFDEAELEQTVKKGLSWFRNSGVLLDEGVRGATEGFHHQIFAKDGVHMPADSIRTDCVGEVGGAYLLDWMTTGNQESKKRFENLEDFCFNYMQIKEGPHRGMLRWTAGAWETCYNDDTARVVLATLLQQNFTKEGSRHFSDAVESLQYLLDTTSPNGLRNPRSSVEMLDGEWYRKFCDEIDTRETKAHHNAFHLAMFLLAYRQGAGEVFRKVGVQGLTTLMNLFPYNRWETSETEELCRMIFPLAVLYQVTGEEKHKQWLYQMTKKLERLQHPSGGYREWDTDYHADCSRRANGECALLANNGDPVVDLLYSNNWLPLGFSYAYLVTGDEYFRQKWEETARFMINCQIHSDDPKLNGAWTRAFDLERREIYGVPHDLGWAPCCIESGWTVGEILMGLQFMKIVQAERNK